MAVAVAVGRERREKQMPAFDKLRTVISAMPVLILAPVFANTEIYISALCMKTLMQPFGML